MAERGRVGPWLLVLALSLGPAVSNGFARFAYGLILPAMQTDLAWTYTQAGWINTANALGYLVGALFALATIQRFGAKALFMGGMVLTAVTLTLSGLTTDFWLLSTWRILAGIGGAPVFIAGAALASAQFRENPSRNTMAIAAYFGGGGVGMLVSGLTLPMLLERFGAESWQAAWLVLGLASSLAAVFSLACVRNAAGPKQPSEPAPGANSLPVRAMLPELSGYTLFAVGHIVYLTFLVAWMTADGADALLVSTVWGLMSLMVIVSPFLWRPVMAAYAGGTPQALSCLVIGTAMLLPLVVDGVAALLISAALFGSAVFMPPASITSFSRMNLSPELWGRSIALFTVLFSIGQTIGPIAAGAIGDATGGVANGLFAAAIVLLLAAAISAFQSPLRAVPGAERLKG
ncbi:MAG: YbfB/YjiJ family MFS transporter [Pseudomonadota bacterium]